MSNELMVIFEDAEVEDYSPPSTASSITSDDSGIDVRRRTIVMEVGGRVSHIHLRPHHLDEAIQYLKKSVRMSSMSGGGRPPDPNGLAVLLSQKERDLELAAKIGQTLLDDNKELQAKNEFLEENLAANAETVVQLKHELVKKTELLRIYSHYDDDEINGLVDTNSSVSLRKRIERLTVENDNLRHESSSLRALADTSVDRERRQVKELSRHLDSANDKIISLQDDILSKSEECSAQTESLENLLHQLNQRCGKERELLEENEELNFQLEHALERHDCLQREMYGLQEQYAELRGIFSEAEEELQRYRQAPQRSHSIDSLYDSLASELENSDSGFSSTPAMSARTRQNLHLELSNCLNAPQEVDVPSHLLTELAHKRFHIEQQLTAPPQTPASDRSTVTAEGTPQLERKSIVSEDCSALTPSESATPAKSAALLRSATCDASTSTLCLVDESILAATPLATLTPKKADAATTPDLEIEGEHSTPKMENGGIFQYGSASASASASPIRRLGLAARAATATLTGSSSDDSLDGYVAPKLGEPGMPGTRDLDFSLRMLKTKRQNKLKSLGASSRSLGVGLAAALAGPDTIKAPPPAPTTSTSASACNQRKFSSLVRRVLVRNHIDAQVEKDFAQFRRRKGLPPSSFFGKDEQTVSAKRQSSQDGWTDYSVSFGLEHNRSTTSGNHGSIGLGAVRAVAGPGVVTRAELSSPTSSPHRMISPSFPAGLSSILSSSSPLTGGFSGGGILRRCL